MPWRGGIDAPTLGAGDMKVGNGGTRQPIGSTGDTDRRESAVA